MINLAKTIHEINAKVCWLLYNRYAVTPTAVIISIPVQESKLSKFTLMNRLIWPSFYYFWVEFL